MSDLLLLPVLLCPCDDVGRRGLHLRVHGDLALERELQHLIGRRHEVELHVGADVLRDVRQILLVVFRKDRLTDPVAMRGE